ncbi:MAG: FAD-binding oxidoreductase [Candidatus Binatia bacterium]
MTAEETKRIPSTLLASFDPGQLREGRSTDAIDGVTPLAVVTVRSCENVETAMREAVAADLAVVPTGGGTELDKGNIPAAFDLRLSTTAMAAARDHSPEDMTVTVGAGMTLGRLNRTLACAGQRIPLDPPDQDRATLGGLVAADSSCSGNCGFGRWRDLVLGLTVVDGSGRRLRTGGRVVKNVAGYDLTRMFAGSRGSLGIITELTLRTLPLAEDTLAMEFDFDRVAAIDSARASLFACDISPVAVDFSHEPGRVASSWTLVVGLEGTHSEIGDQSLRLERICGRAPSSTYCRWQGPAAAAAEATLRLRVVCPPATALRLGEDLLGALGDRREQASLNGHLHEAILFLSLQASDPCSDGALLARLRSLALKRDARLVIDRAPVGVKRLVDSWGAAPAGLAIMRTIKRRFDPHGLLTPGRLGGSL